MKTVEEASTLGWPPGKYKESFEHEHRIYKLVDREVVNGEVVSWLYRSKDGHEFVVLND